MGLVQGGIVKGDIHTYISLALLDGSFLKITLFALIHLSLPHFHEIYLHLDYWYSGCFNGFECLEAPPVLETPPRKTLWSLII